MTGIARSLSDRLRTTVASKIMAALALIALLVFGVTAAITYLQARNAITPVTESLMEASAEQVAAELRAELELAMDSIQTLARTFGSLSASGIRDREVGRRIVADELEAHPDLVLMWMIWEPQAWDGRDEAWRGAPGHTDSGRYYVSYGREDGRVAMEMAPVPTYDVPGDGDYYLLPKALRRPVVVEPYVYPIDGVDVLMTSLAAPILRDGEFVGVFGGDIALERMREILAGFAVIGGGAHAPAVARWHGARRCRCQPARTAHAG